MSVAAIAVTAVAAPRIALDFNCMKNSWVDDGVADSLSERMDSWYSQI